MADLDRLLKVFINKEVRLDKNDISASARSREWLLNGIKNKINEKRNQPVLFADKPFLYFGSYFKGTKVGCLDEYDIMVIIDCNGGQYTHEGNKIGEGLGRVSPNPKYAGIYHKQDNSGVSPNKILNWLKSIVEEVVSPYGMEAPIRNGQAVTVHSASTNTTFDLVPAGIFHNVEIDEVFFNIPKGDKNNGWILTDPASDMELLDMHAKNRDNYKNVIRLIKLLKGSYNFLVPSFTIECNSISYSATNKWYNILSLDFLGVLRYLQANFQAGQILDTFDLENNTIEGVESLEWYAERIDDIIASINNLDYEMNETLAYEKLYRIMYNI